MKEAGNQGNISLAEQVARFAELRKSEAFVKRWTRHYFDRDAISGTEIESILNDLTGRTSLLPVHAAKALEDTEAVFAAEIHAKQKNPGMLALLYARRAKLRKIAGQDFVDELVAAQELLQHIQVSSRIPPSLEHVRAQALIHGIEQSYVAGLSKPGLKELEAYTKESGDIATGLLEQKETRLSGAALLLSEDERDAYLGSFPESSRAEISALLDRYVSSVLHSNVVNTQDEAHQARRVEERATDKLKSLIVSDEFMKLPRILKLVCVTLAELDSVDSVHVLDEVGKMGLDRHVIERRNDSPQERLRRWGAFARVIKTQSDVPSVVANAGMLSMKYLALAHLPDRLFDFFLRKMAQTGFVTRNISSFPTSDIHNKRLLHEIITRYPSQFNTIFDTLSDIPHFSAQRHEKDVLDALSHFHTLLPATLEVYMAGTFRERARLLDSIRTSRAGIYRNLPIETSEVPKDIPLSEHVYMATEPVHMSFSRFERMFSRLVDRTADLNHFTFPQDGYAFELRASGNGAPKVKENQVVNIETLQFYRQACAQDVPRDGDARALALIKALAQIVKGGTLQTRDMSVPLVFSLMAQDKSRNEFLAEFQNATTDNAYQYILGLEPLLEDVDVQRTYAGTLQDFLTANPDSARILLEACKNPARYTTLTTRIASSVKQGFHLAFDIPSQIEDYKDVAALVTASLYATSFAPMRREIAKEKKKFESPKDKKDMKDIDNLRAYVSKNVAAFFARASVGICTFEDVSSWNRENYFHINIVEDNEHLRANIQAFAIRLDSKPILLLRGVNPNSPFLKRINPGNFCEEILKIARKFQEDNGLEGVYISEQAEWHALSNRKPISDYLIANYAKPENEVVLPRPMVMSKTVGLQTISKIYKVS